MVLFVVLAFSMGLFIYYHINIQHHLRTEREKIAAEYTKLVYEIRDNLIFANNDLFSEYINDKASERNVFTAFYNFLANNTAQPGRFLLLNSSGNLVFDSGGGSSPDRRLQLHLSILIDNMGDNVFIQHVFLPANRESYLVLLGKLFQGSEIAGYGVFLVSGDNFMPEPSMIGVQYVIFDRHNSVFARSASLFLQDSIYKVENILQSRTFGYGYQRFFTQHVPLGDNMQLIVYMQDSHLSILILFFLVTNGVIIVVALLQSRYYSQKFAHSNIKSIEILARDSEKRRLENQFDVHFLSNTLEAVRSYINFDPKFANDLILSLNTILRYNIDESRTETTIEEDMAYIKSYLGIFAMRFNHFSYTIEVDNNALQFKIPKLILAPLIENSIKYGFSTRKDLEISIEIRKIEKLLFFRVTDNGGGISEEILLKIQESRTPNRHGLYNSQKRLSLMYPDSEFKVTSKDGFTIIDILIGEPHV